MSMHEADPDLWGHIQYGREILETGDLPRTATWTCSAEGHRWVNHENIAELAMAWAYDRFGVRGLTIGKYLFGMCVIGLAFWSGRQGGTHPALIGGMCAVAALSLEFHWHFRPQVFGYVFFAIVAALLRSGVARLERADAGASWRTFVPWLWLVPVMTLWTNTHGSFAAGLAVIFAVLGLEWLRVVGRTTLTWFPANACEGEPASSVRRSVRGIAGIAVATLLGTFCNPYGPGLHQWLLEDVILPRPEIGDWQPLSLFSGDRESLCFWVIAGSIVLSAWRAERRQWSLLIVTLLLAWQALSHVRHLALLAIVWVMWFPVPLEQLRRRFLSSVARTRTPGWGIAWGEGTPLSAAMLAGWILAVGWWTWPNVSDVKVNGTQYPVDAFAFLAKHRLEGRTLVTFNWAQYAIGMFADAGLNSTVPADGRLRTCYPQEVIDRHFDFIFGSDYKGPRYRSPRSGPIDPSATLRVDRPDYVLISRKQRPSVRTMESLKSDWRLLYQDGLTQLWGRRDVAVEIPTVDFGDVIPTAVASYPGFPDRPFGNDAAPPLVSRN